MSSKNQDDQLPESGMGGASDSGAHGKHPASAAKLTDRSARPDDVPGDAAIERRHHHDSNYNGAERRIAGKTGRG